MTFQQKSQELPKPLEDFARGLLATTCLSVAFSTSGLASTFTLTFSDQSTEPGTLLPVGTTVVNGFVGLPPVELGLVSDDWFEFQGLTAGDTYTLTAASWTLIFINGRDLAAKATSLSAVAHITRLR